MPELQRPMELLDLAPGASLSFVATGFDEGETTIYPAGAPGGKVVSVLRVHIEPESKSAFPYYWDITSLTLAAQLRPILQGAAGARRRYTVTKVGSGPGARFQLDVAPAEGSPVR